MPTPESVPRVTRCTTDEALAAASILFDEYRHHHGAASAGDDESLGWLGEMVRSGLLTVWTAATGPTGSPPVGLATSHVTPASLAMGRSWQLRDLYVVPEARRRGVAAALVGVVRDAALAAGATRLSLVTEVDNDAALALYGRLEFAPVEGLTTLSLDLG